MEKFNIRGRRGVVMITGVIVLVIALVLTTILIGAGMGWGKRPSTGGKTTDSSAAAQDPDSLLPVLEKQIKSDYVAHWNSSAPKSERMTVDNVSINRYLGIYGHCVALMISDNHTCVTLATWETKIAGYLFSYADGRQIMVWKDGVFETLPDAYKKGFLFKEDVKAIQLRFQGLSSTDEKQIKEDYLSWRKPNPNDKKPYDSSYVRIDHYFGYFGGKNQPPELNYFSGSPEGSVVVLIHADYETFPADKWEIYINGFTFKYANRQQILVWNKGTFKTLQEAYESEILSWEAIEGLRMQHKKLFPELYN